MNRVYKLKIPNKKEMKDWVKLFAENLKPGDVYFLDGDLGAGKTQMVKWIGECLGVDEQISSPTFSLVHHYHGKDIDINHLDLYRMENPMEIEELDYEDLFYPIDEVTFIEWADRAEDYFPSNIIHLAIDKGEDEEREIYFKSSNNRTVELEDKLIKEKL